MSKKPSLYPTGEGCFICHNPTVVRHHIYGGHGRRPISDDEGCWVELCPAHHNGSDFGVHFDHELDQFFKEDCERRWCERNQKTAKDFLETFGINYLEEE